MSFGQTFRNLDDVLRKEASCSSELDYTEQSSWLLFLKYLDDNKAQRAELEGKALPPSHSRRAIPLGRLGRTQKRRR